MSEYDTKYISKKYWIILSKIISVVSVIIFRNIAAHY